MSKGSPVVQQLSAPNDTAMPLLPPGVGHESEAISSPTGDLNTSGDDGVRLWDPDTDTNTLHGFTDPLHDLLSNDGLVEVSYSY
jgi:hypothetical protein